MSIRVSQSKTVGLLLRTENSPVLRPSPMVKDPAQFLERLDRSER